MSRKVAQDEHEESAAQYPRGVEIAPRVTDSSKPPKGNSTSGQDG
ncbi:MAG: hypothetical protein ACLT98_09415 [Eggerthellaceae bacterium]